MNVVHKLFPSTAAGVHVVEDASSLDTFCSKDCAAAIWRRAIPSDLKDWLDALPETRLPRGRVLLRPDDVEHAILQLCDIHDTPHGPERDWLVRDIADVARRFADLLDVGFIRLRLDVITTNACRKFHIDAVHSRVICTYRGTGTQFGTANPGEDPDRVFTVATGDPMLLRGTLWRETPSARLLHRSPPIEGSGETRLVLVIDPVFDPTDEL